MNSNRETLNAYEGHVQEYISGTPQEVAGYVKEWIDTALGYLPQDGSILELGSAFGRDAAYIEDKGYSIRRTDATKGFVDFLRSKGHQADMLNAITDDLGGPYDMVFADAVLLHFTADEFQHVVSKVKQSLVPNGIFAFTLKQGVGAEWSDAKLGVPRFFQYWQPDTLSSVLNAMGFSILKLDSDSTGKWLQTIVRN